MIAYHVDSVRKIVVTRVSGRLTFGELAGHLHRLMRDPKFSPDYNALIVAMDAAAVPPPTSVSAFTPLVRAWSVRRVGVKWAFVLPTKETRAFAESALNEVKLTTLTTRCFLSEAAALGWLEPAAAPATNSANTDESARVAI
jgi:hypothetical protein